MYKKYVMSIGISAPRPPGVRHSNGLKKTENGYVTYNTLPALRPLESCGARASFRSHSLTPLQPDFGSPMLAQTSQAGSVRRKFTCTVFVKTPAHPCAGEEKKLDKEMQILYYVRRVRMVRRYLWNLQR
jgi:hypothetical protein